MEHFVIIVNDWKLLTIITKSSILDVAAVLDPPLGFYIDFSNIIQDFLLKAIIIKSLIEKREKEKSYLVLLKLAIPITVVVLMLVTH